MANADQSLEADMESLRVVRAWIDEGPDNGPLRRKWKARARGRAAVALHVGPYDRLKQTWAAFGAWMGAEGLERGAAPWEEYVSDCDVTPAEDLQTRIVCPLAE